MADEEAKVDVVIATRLWKLYNLVWTGNLYEKARANTLQKYPAVHEFVPEDKRTNLPDAWDLGRVRHFYELLRAGKSIDPIDVDNECHNGFIYPVPIVLDGHHRLVAAALARARIPVHYGGRIDLLDYLTGKRRTAPTA
jgi:hypothetical protein